MAAAAMAARKKYTHQPKSGTEVLPVWRCPHCDKSMESVLAKNAKLWGNSSCPNCKRGVPQKSTSIESAKVRAPAVKVHAAKVPAPRISKVC
jgi:ssDNA-binding Zn-finger/Zn-ribbon topoisomerase 1